MTFASRPARSSSDTEQRRADGGEIEKTLFRKETVWDELDVSAGRSILNPIKSRELFYISFDLLCDVGIGGELFITGDVACQSDAPGSAGRRRKTQALEGYCHPYDISIARDPAIGIP